MIAADGQDIKEAETVDAIVKASHFPLSIVMIGVGDGPWDKMEDFDDKIPERAFDNFQCLEFFKVIRGSKSPAAAFALHALMEIPGEHSY